MTTGGRHTVPASTASRAAGRLDVICLMMTDATRSIVRSPLFHRRTVRFFHIYLYIIARISIALAGLYVYSTLYVGYYY